MLKCLFHLLVLCEYFSVVNLTLCVLIICALNLRFAEYFVLKNEQEEYIREHARSTSEKPFIYSPSAQKAPVRLYSLVYIDVFMWYLITL